MPQIKLAAAPFPDQRLMALSVFQVTRPLFEDLFAQFCTCVLATLGPLPLMLWWSHALVEISMADVYVVALSQSSIATSADPLKGSASLFPFALSASHAVSLSPTLYAIGVEGFSSLSPRILCLYPGTTATGVLRRRSLPSASAMVY
jgi:hypothetical protein